MFEDFLFMKREIFQHYLIAFQSICHKLHLKTAEIKHHAPFLI